MPVEALWGVGAATAEKFRAHGISTIGELERRDQAELEMFLGPHAARHLHAIAHRRDPRRVRRGRSRRSIGTQSAFAGGRRSGSELEALLVTLVDRVTRRARAANRAGRTVTLRFRFGDFSRATRSRTLPHRPQAQPRSSPPRDPSRHLRADDRASRHHPPRNHGGQPQHRGPARAPPRAAGEPALDLAIDEIRERFGNDAIGGARPRPRRRDTSPRSDATDLTDGLRWGCRLRRPRPKPSPSSGAHCRSAGERSAALASPVEPSLPTLICEPRRKAGGSGSTIPPETS